MSLRKIQITGGTLDSAGNFGAPLTAGLVDILKPGMTIKSGAPVWTSTGGEENLVVVAHPGAVNKGTVLTLLQSGLVIDAVFTVTTDEPVFTGGEWKVKVTSSGWGATQSTPVTGAAGDRFIIPSGDVTSYTDPEGTLGSDTNGAYTMDATGIVEKFIYEPVVDIRLSASGFTTRYYTDVAANIDGSWVTPEMFGAAGDGTTDDTKAFNKMVSYAGNAANVQGCLIPCRTYLISTVVDIDASITIKGKGGGSILKGANTSGTRLFTISADDVTIQDLKLVGQTTTEATVATAAIEIDNTADSVTLENLWITGTSATAGWNQGIQVGQNVKNLSINGCRFDRIIGTNFPTTASATATTYGVSVLGDLAFKMSMTNCNSTHTTTQGNVHVILSNLSTQCRIENNMFTSGRYDALYIWALTAASIRNTITGNTFASCCNSGLTNVHGIIHLEGYADRNIISGNLIYDGGSDGILLEGDGTVVNTCDRNQISDNIIDSCDNVGINILGASYNNITGNNLLGNGATGPTAAFKLANSGSSDADFNWIKGNFVTGTAASYSLQIASGDANVIHGNYLVDGATGDYLDSGSNNRWHLNDTADTLEIVTSENASIPGTLTLGSTLATGGVTTLGGSIDVNGYTLSNRSATSFWVSTPAATSATDTTLSKINGTVTDLGSQDFTITTTAGGRATYTGTTTKLFLVQAHVGFQSSLNSVVHYVAIAKQGTGIAASKVGRSSGTGTVQGACSTTQQVSLATNEYIEIFCSVASSTANITMQNCVVTITEV